MNSMILAISGVSIAINLLLVLLVAVCLLLCLVVLMQRPKQEGLGAAFGGGMTDQAFGARTTDVLQKGTVYLGTAFFIITLALSILVSANNAKADEAAEVKSNTEEQLADPEVEAEVEAAIAAETEEVEAEVTTPEVEAPAEESPAAAAIETPAVEETPAVDLPAVETPQDETPAVEVPVEEALEEEAPVESPAAQ